MMKFIKKFISFTDSLVSDSETFNELFYSSVFEKIPLKLMFVLEFN